MKLDILIPVYNEERWLEETVQRVVRQQVNGITTKRIILVDDSSKDKTRDVIAELLKKFPSEVVAVFHETNQGKGAAVRTAVQHITGDICLIQDADLEYDPADYGLLLEPIIAGRADCVYGSRFTGTQSKRVIFFWHMIGNKLITLLSNILTNMNFTDIETGYKAFRSDLLKSIPIRSNRFGIEPELTAKISRRRCRIYEVGISYQGRTYAEGKKITWKDGVQAVFLIIKYWLVDDSIKK